MLGYPAGHQPPPESVLPCSVWRMPMLANMPAEAHCQDDRGINAETWLRDFGLLALKIRTVASTIVRIHIYELKSKTHFVLDKGCTLVALQ